jgi:hypothetical protein
VANKLTDTLAAIEKDLTDKLARVKAAEVRLAALESTHHDLLREVAERQAELAQLGADRDFVRTAKESGARILEILEKLNV